jgi:cytochrome c
MLRKFLFATAITTLLISCGSNDKPAGAKTNEQPSISAPDNSEKLDNSENPDYQKGLALVGKSGCLTCHAVNDKIQGPSYRDIAEKYKNEPDTIVRHLASKIVVGGSGVWDEIPMPAQPVTQEEAEAMVKYIMLLKK